ncbi:hypothetical protein ABLE91_16925 [Aquabacter sp. CN5-332]|uniref:hypothetical protein n=1 Tax=Aquabacter sp. CN5-332 TaxID=3156608 RepID=UPI0032B3B7F2
MAKQWNTPLARTFSVSWHREWCISTISEAIAFMMDCCGTLSSRHFDEAMDALIRAATTGERADIIEATADFRRFLTRHNMVHALS